VCVTVPSFTKIGQTVAEIWQFNGFQNGGHPPSWFCEIQTFLTVGEVKRTILHQHTKFRKDQSNRCGDIAIFVSFQDGGRRHLGFQQFKILTIEPLPGANIRHRAKFHQNRSNGSRDIAI